MPAVAGHELPTPGNADSPKQRKHREQAIVIGTLVLVLLTFMLVMRHGANAQPDTSPAPFQPDESGGGSDPYAQQLGTISQQIGALPGQFQAVMPHYPPATSTHTEHTTVREIPAHPRGVAHPLTHHHPTHPKRPIRVTHHAPIHKTVHHGYVQRGPARHHYEADPPIYREGRMAAT